MADTYTNGLIEGVRLLGGVCSRYGDCDLCPVGKVRGTGMTCHQFAMSQPEKMLSLLQEADRNLTYCDEYNIRFPNADADIDYLAEILCRRCVFEGETTCKVTNNEICRKCWGCVYVGDVDPSPVFTDNDDTFETDILDTTLF